MHAWIQPACLPTSLPIHLMLAHGCVHAPTTARVWRAEGQFSFSTTWAFRLALRWALQDHLLTLALSLTSCPVK